MMNIAQEFGEHLKSVEKIHRKALMEIGKIIGGGGENFDGGSD